MHETHLGQTSLGRRGGGGGGGSEGKKRAMIRSACQGNDTAEKGERHNTERFTAISLFCAIKGVFHCGTAALARPESDNSPQEKEVTGERIDFTLIPRL